MDTAITILLIVSLASYCLLCSVLVRQIVEYRKERRILENIEKRYLEELRDVCEQCRERLKPINEVTKHE